MAMPRGWCAMSRGIVNDGAVYWIALAGVGEPTAAVLVSHGKIIDSFTFGPLAETGPPEPAWVGVTRSSAAPTVTAESLGAVAS